LVGDIATLNSLQKNRQESSGDLSSVPFHPADAGSDNFEQEFTLGLMGNEQNLLREIEDALSRITKGTYGVCVATLKPITKARLQAKPWAKHCIEYARTLEKGGVRRV
jgi:RNA polymerase-binding transcription factor DksA